MSQDTPHSDPGMPPNRVQPPAPPLYRPPADDNSQGPSGQVGIGPNDVRQPGPPQSYYTPQQTPPLTPSEDQQWATFAHFGGLLGALPSLIIYLMFKDRGRFAAQESREALNFQITVAICALAGWILLLIPYIGLLFGLCLFALWIGNLVFSIRAGLSATRGQPFKYPFSFHLVK